MREDNGVAKRWMQRTKERLAQNVERVEISITANEVRSHIIESGKGNVWEHFEDWEGKYASFNDHEAIHEARKAVIAWAKDWELVEDKAYSLVFKRKTLMAVRESTFSTTPPIRRITDPLNMPPKPAFTSLDNKIVGHPALICDATFLCPHCKATLNVKWESRRESD